MNVIADKSFSTWNLQTAQNSFISSSICEAQFPVLSHWHTMKGSRIVSKARKKKRKQIPERWSLLASFPVNSISLLGRNWSWWRNLKGGARAWQYNSAMFTGINKKTKSTIQKRTEERRQKETFKTQRRNNMLLFDCKRAEKQECNLSYECGSFCSHFAVTLSGLSWLL